MSSANYMCVAITPIAMVMRLSRASLKLRVTMGPSSIAINAVLKCNLSRVALENILAAWPMIAKTRANYCEVERRHRQKWIQCQCLSCNVSKWMTRMSCAMVLPVFFWQQVSFRRTVKPALRLLMRFCHTKQKLILNITFC